MSAVLAQKPEPANPSAWTFRDEIAMRAMVALVRKGDWSVNGAHMRKTEDFSGAAYAFADAMLKAREG